MRLKIKASICLQVINIVSYEEECKPNQHIRIGNTIKKINSIQMEDKNNKISKLQSIEVKKKKTKKKGSQQN